MVSPMDRHSKRPPTHLNTHSVKCSDAAGLGGLGDAFHMRYCLCQEFLALILLLSADLHKSDSKPIQKNNKEIKKEKKTFILQWRYMFTEVSWKRAGREKQFDGRLAASFWSSEFPVGLQWQQRTCFQKVAQNLKHYATQPTVMYDCLKTIDFSLFPHLRCSLDLLRKYINIVTRPALKQKTGCNTCGWNQK